MGKYIRKIYHKTGLLFFIGILLSCNVAVAEVNEAWESIIDRLSFHENLVNHGLVANMQGYTNFLTYDIENDGNMLFSVNVTCRGNKIINHQKGYIAFGGYIDCYDYTNGVLKQAVIENAGTIAVINGVGDSSYDQWTAHFYGKIINKLSGKFLVNRNNGFNLLSGSRLPNIENSGYFEIAQGSIWDASDYSEGSYLQLEGETRVDGVFGANGITINKGVLSGSGTIQGYFNESPLFDKVTIAPGSASKTGTLTLIPDENYLMCVRCSIAIELSGSGNSDQLQVDGDISMNNWKLNVQLRDGYVPTPATTFTVITANSVTYYGPAPTYNLPKLPNGRTWSVENTGTEIRLTAN